MKTLLSLQLRTLAFSCLAMLFSASLMAQEEPKKEDSGSKPAKPAFESAELMDLQSVMVPVKKTLEFNIQHRFGTVSNGITDLYGIYAPSNIRLGFSYVPINNLQVGFGFTKFKKYVDINVKYSILKQTRDWKMPVSLTFYGNTAIDTRAPENFAQELHRLSYHAELIVAARINDKISVQVAPSFSHFNAVDSLFKNDVLAVSVGARYKFTPQSSILVTYVQQITTYPTNPNFTLKPGLTVGWEVATSAHAFQMFFTTFQGIVPQENIAFNSYDFSKGDFLIGFNITRLWNF